MNKTSLILSGWQEFQSFISSLKLQDYLEFWKLWNKKRKLLKEWRAQLLVGNKLRDFLSLSWFFSSSVISSVAFGSSLQTSLVKTIWKKTPGLRWVVTRTSQCLTNTQSQLISSCKQLLQSDMVISRSCPLQKERFVSFLNSSVSFSSRSPLVLLLQSSLIMIMLTLKTKKKYQFLIESWKSSISLLSFTINSWPKSNHKMIKRHSERRTHSLSNFHSDWRSEPSCTFTKSRMRLWFTSKTRVRASWVGSAHFWSSYIFLLSSIFITRLIGSLRFTSFLRELLGSFSHSKRILFTLKSITLIHSVTLTLLWHLAIKRWTSKKCLRTSTL